MIFLVSSLGLVSSLAGDSLTPSTGEFLHSSKATFRLLMLSCAFFNILCTVWTLSSTPESPGQTPIFLKISWTQHTHIVDCSLTPAHLDFQVCQTLIWVKPLLTVSQRSFRPGSTRPPELQSTDNVTYFFILKYWSFADQNLQLFSVAQFPNADLTHHPLTSQRFGTNCSRNLSRSALSSCSGMSSTALTLSWSGFTLSADWTWPTWTVSVLLISHLSKFTFRFIPWSWSIRALSPVMLLLIFTPNYHQLCSQHPPNLWRWRHSSIRGDSGAYLQLSSSICICQQPWLASIRRKPLNSCSYLFNTYRVLLHAPSYIKFLIVPHQPIRTFRCLSFLEFLKVQLEVEPLCYGTSSQAEERTVHWGSVLYSLSYI